MTERERSLWDAAKGGESMWWLGVSDGREAKSVPDHRHRGARRKSDALEGPQFYVSGTLTTVPERDLRLNETILPSQRTGYRASLPPFNLHREQHWNSASKRE